MKQIFVKIIAAATILTLFAAVSFSAVSVTEFSDVPTEFWGYKTIMKMTEAGLFRGTTEPINGVGTFSPDKVMTRAEFITTAIRAVYPDEAKTIENDKTRWWNSYYAFALEKGIVVGEELDGGELDEPMTREEMAMIMVRCVEKLGEELTKRVETTQIPDYSDIGEYYKNYVIDCFSFGLLCGIDTNGTFAPAQSLTRVQAATVLCRLIDKDERIAVNFPGDESNNQNEEQNQEQNQNTNQNGNQSPDDSGTSTPHPPAENEPTDFPWDNGGKPTSEYTWEEYEALPDNMKNAFYDSFESLKAFIKWLNLVHPNIAEPDLGDNNGSDSNNNDNVNDNNENSGGNDNNTDNGSDNGNTDNESGNDNNDEPPVSGGEKQASEYTWEDFLALSEEDKNTFSERFESAEAFKEWIDRVQPEPESDLPWDNGGKQPGEYSWNEYEALPEEMKSAFYESFESEAAFNEWFTAVQPEPESDFPWDNGGKQPSEYTWDEFQALTEEEQDAFLGSFNSMAEFEAWLIANMPVPDEE